MCFVYIFKLLGVVIIPYVYNCKPVETVHSDSPKKFLFDSCQKIDLSDSIRLLFLYSRSLRVVLQQKPASRVD